MSKEKNSSFEFPSSLQPILWLIASLLIFLSLLSFSQGDSSTNWLGLFGHLIGWSAQYLFGLSSFLIPIYLGWIALSPLLDKPILHFKIKALLFLFALLSFSILLSLLVEAFPSSALPFKRWIPERYYLGGVPMYHLGLIPLFGRLGTLIIFGAIFLLSFLLIAELNPLKLFASRPKKTTSPKERVKQERPAREELEDYSPPTFIEPLPPPPMPVKKKMPIASPSNYLLPPPTLLTQVKKTDSSSLKNDLRLSAKLLEETLLSFSIEAKVGNISVGPTINSFEVQPAVGVKVQRIKALENDIALNMQAKSIRIIAPIPGKAAVGIEVPNPHPQEVGFREILENYQNGQKKGAIPLLLGKSVSGEDVWADLTKMPHMIIAGATGSGKSVCINTIVMSILMNAEPGHIKLLMVDPKKVELTAYSNLPHMLAPVITEAGEAHGAFNWLVKEMERRYEIFRRLGIRNIALFNERQIDKEREANLGMEIPEHLPFIVAIVDELADLMMVSSNDIETPIARIAQMARAVGIHLILATQRPSREVITGLIKANFPCRISFKVANRINSQIIIDENGAETLLGNGDMLFMPPGTSALMRAQGAYIRDEDIAKVIEFICKQMPTQYLIPSFKEFKAHEGKEENDEESDTLYAQAKALILETGNASTTFLQRKLKIGYARAASLMDQLESNGVIGPAEGAKPRKIFFPTNEEI